MKPIISVGALVFLLFTCHRGEDQENAIRRVSTSWDQAYTAVHSLGQQLEEVHRFWEEKYVSMQIPEDELADLDEDSRRQMSEYREVCRQQGKDLDAITLEIKSFTIRFNEETGRLEELENQLEEGLRIDHAHEKAAKFQTDLTEIFPKVNTWQRHLEKIRENCRHSCEAYHRLATGGREN